MKPKAISGGEGASVEIWGLPFEDGVFLEAIPKAGSVIAWSGGAVTTLVAHAANGEDGARSAVTASMDDSVVTIMASTSVSVVDIEKGDKSKRILP
jgi:hypothetical protein